MLSMGHLADRPLLVVLLSFPLLWLAARAGIVLRDRRNISDREAQEDVGVVLAATLTLLGLIIGFSFSMAITRYDQRKNLEEGEANAIGTEYLRADLLPGDAPAAVKALLSRYLDQRILFYSTRNPRRIQAINRTTTGLEADLWRTVRLATGSDPSFPFVTVTISGMNDVFNAHGYTQAAWENRIPSAAWALMTLIAICANILIGFGTHRTKAAPEMLLVLPLIVSIAFFLIVDIDSPRAGSILIQSHNLLSLSESIHAR